MQHFIFYKAHIGASMQLCFVLSVLVPSHTYYNLIELILHLLHSIGITITHSLLTKPAPTNFLYTWTKGEEKPLSVFCILFITSQQ